MDLYHIKTHYFTAHPKLNYYAVVPVSLTMTQLLHPYVFACPTGECQAAGRTRRSALQSGGRRLPELAWAARVYEQRPYWRRGRCAPPCIELPETGWQYLVYHDPAVHP